jgi:carbamoyltransferase
LRKFLKEGAAGGAQRFCEDLVARWVAKTMKNNRLSHLAVSGSLSMNHRVMARIAALKEIEGLWVPPDSGDGALALGACFHLATIRFGKTPEPLTDAGLGPDAGTAGLDGFELVENPSAELVAGLLADGAVIARCAGRAEFGSRALGNRSILADPRNAKAVPFIAAKIKRRDSQASFSPTILAEAAPRYLKNPKKIPSPFMTLAFQATPRARKDLAAAVDAEGLVRPQVLAPAANPDFARLIKAFGKKTGVPALLNTSFNEHGKPMALTAPDAVRAFKDSSLDYLLLGRVLVGRRA